MLCPDEISMIVSSAPENGAVNRSADGSFFEIQLQDALTLPKDALNPTVCVEEALVWWSIPNILTGVNDKMYITGTSALVSTTDKLTLGFPALSAYSMTIISLVPDLSTLSIGNIGGGMPIGVFQVGDMFQPTTGVNTGVLYTIIGISNDTAISKTYTITGLLESNILSTTGNFNRVRTNIETNYIITIPQGLYDLSGLQSTILRDLENQGAIIDPDPLILFSPDEATQKVEIRFNYPNVSIDFTQPDTPREILGFNSAIYGAYPNAPITILAPNVAGFNTVNSLLIHSDLTSRGIRFNNDYNQTITQVLIDVSPGSQIVSKPFNPPRIPLTELVNAKRTNIRFWLTDDKNRRVNTNGEYWSVRMVIRYLRPVFIGDVKTGG